MEKDKKEISSTAKVFVGIGFFALLIAAYFLGHSKGYDKGFDKGVGWE